MGWPADPSSPEKARPPCPICGRPGTAEFRPFCSKRCADVDLNRWLSGTYAIPAPEDAEEADEDGEGEEGA
jgi:endogenous inhibitor of DNA gyrase (YacG/DUF329 family)